MEDDKKIIELKERFIKDELTAEEYTKQKNKIEEEMKAKEEKIYEEITENEEEKLKLKEEFIKEGISAEEYNREKSKLEKQLDKELKEEVKSNRHRVVTEGPGNTWKYVSAVLAVIVVILLLNFGLPKLPSRAAESLEIEQVASNAVGYINSNLLRDGAAASLIETKEANGVYQLTIKVNDQTINVYATKDGKLLFPTGVEMTSNPGEQPSEQDSQKIDIDTEDDPSRGPNDAKVTIVEFSDYQCPFCSKAEKTINEIFENYKDQIRIVYRDFPLGFHPFAQKAAEASECADEQGKFWEYHDALFEKQADWSSTGASKFREYAKELGLDEAQFNECLDSGKYTDEVQKDLEDGKKYGVSGTPAFFINGIEVTGAQPYSVFEDVIEQELNKA